MVNDVYDCTVRGDLAGSEERCVDRTVLLPEELIEEIANLSRALRDSRERLHRGALESTRRICALSSEVTRLESLNLAYRRRLESTTVDCPVVEMLCRLARCHEENEALRGDVRRMGVLEKALRDAHAECDRMAGERDCLVQEVAHLQRQLASVQQGGGHVQCH